MWNFISTDDYENLLNDIICKSKNLPKSFQKIYQNIFREFWLQSPSALKSYITHDFDNNSILLCLFKAEDENNLELILKDTTNEEKQKFLYSKMLETLCICTLHHDTFYMLNILIKELFLAFNEKEMLKCKDHIEQSISHPYLKNQLEKKKHKWDELFHFSDNSNDESSASKRLCL